MLNFIRAEFEGMYQHSKLVDSISNPKLFIFTLYYRLEKTISLIFFFHFCLTQWEMVQCRKNLIIKDLYIPKYLVKLFGKTFGKYSNLNPKYKYVRTYSIISITCCNYNAFLRIWSDLTILHQPVFLQVYNTS